MCLVILQLIAISDAIRSSFEVTLIAGVRGGEVRRLWRDYNLEQDEPRNFFRKPGNFLVVMEERQMNLLASDPRVEQVTQISASSSQIRSQGYKTLQDAVLNRLCGIDDVERVRRQSPCTPKNASSAYVPLRIITSRMYDRSAVSATDVAKNVKAANHHRNTADSVDACAFDMNLRAGDSDNRVLIAKVDERHLCNAVEFLMSIEGVVDIEYLEKSYQLNNNAAATGQSGSKSMVSASNALIWKEGILGQGEIVAIGDSGVDIDSCFFRDDRFSAARLSGCDLSRRKIVCYYQKEGSTFGDDSVSLGGGHGTHVAGTVAGLHAHVLANSSKDGVTLEDILRDSSIPNGIAPMSKIAVLDINGNAPGELIPPDDFATTDFFVRPYEDAGVRIHSNSWGCARYLGHDRECNKYESQTRSMDEFMWRNKDFLVIVAAGNAGALDVHDGNLYRNGFYTVGAPSTNKNGISVGATRRNNRTPFECFTNNAECSVNDLYVSSSRGPTFDGRIKPDLVFPGEKTWSAASSGDPQDFSEGPDCHSSSILLGTKYLSGTVGFMIQWFLPVIILSTRVFFNPLFTRSPPCLP